ncbi:Abscisic acid 8'-hydroxylase [Quillaja saponaria]|uniref:(+)-abscisic acid 8'-hydroxylase n=1 Tax=Quillaja saponaria TaxID=32244 RepID=A0AAD7PFD4_QUISA|nr:Abscisic acid 8'-hydroxylase [Quillaja saponaria]
MFKSFSFIRRLDESNSMYWTLVFLTRNLLWSERVNYIEKRCVLFLFVISSVLFSLFTFLSKQRANLPPGSMGWPYVGETLQLYTQNPTVFFATRQKSPEAVRYVLVTQAHLFKPTYPPSKERLIGPWAIFFHQGSYHTQMRKLVQGAFSLDIIRNLVPQIEITAISALESLCGEQVVNAYCELKEFTFDVAIMSIFGNLDAFYKKRLKENYRTLDKGYNSFPTKLPGTLYSKSVLERKKLRDTLSEIIRKRKEELLEQKDLLGSLLSFKDNKGRQILTNDQIVDNIIGVLFAAQDTTASVMTWILKYVHDDSKLLEAIKKEQGAIYESNDGGKQPLTWAQTRNMPLTNRVIMESMRMASIISFTFREAVYDVEYKGYLIPKGWKVLPLFRNIHHNPDFFAEPHRFNPSRFEGTGIKAHTYMPFGNGVHSCPGNEVAKLEMLIFIHHLVNKFRWKVVGSDSGVQYAPFPVPHQGLPAKFWKEPCKQENRP